MAGARAFVLVVSVILGVSALPVPSTARTPQADVAGESGPPFDRLIIKPKGATLTDAQRAAFAAEWSALAGQPLAFVRPMAGGAEVWRLPRLEARAEAERIAGRIASSPSVAYAEADAAVHALDAPQPAGAQSADLTPNDPQVGSQWHYKAPASGAYGIDALGAWNLVTGSAAINLAVLDTGALFEHPDMAGRWLPGYDLISDAFTARDGGGRDADAADPGDWWAANDCGPSTPARSSTWHGTHVAGTIAAATNNGVGVAGVNWRSRVVPIRVLGRCGGTLSDVVDGLFWAAGLPVPGLPVNPYPAKVLNVSLGGGGACGSALQGAVDAVRAAGATVVAAAGNSAADAANTRPANCAGVIAVAATTRTGQRAYYSNYGPVVTIAAPGGETHIYTNQGVLSTLNAGATAPAAMTYGYLQGTSQAAPHVAGTIALMLAQDGALSPDWVTFLLRRTVTAFPAGSTCSAATCGAGIVNASAAVQAVRDGSATRRAHLPVLMRHARPTVSSADRGDVRLP